jgi:hypothetical protein
MSHSKLLFHSLGCVGASLLGAGIAWVSVPSEEEALASDQQQEVQKSGATGPRAELLDVLVEITALKRMI